MQSSRLLSRLGAYRRRTWYSVCRLLYCLQRDSCHTRVFYRLTDSLVGGRHTLGHLREALQISGKVRSAVHRACYALRKGCEKLLRGHAGKRLSKSVDFLHVRNRGPRVVLMEIRTDHQALKWFKSQGKLTDKVVRWAGLYVGVRLHDCARAARSKCCC